MFRIGILVILHGLLFDVQSLPRQHHVSGRSGVQSSSSMNLQHDLKTTSHHRYPRDIHLLKLRDPLDCLSQVVCGMNTYPPHKPSVRTSTANDFAFLLRNSISKLRSQKQATTTTTTTTAAPATKRTTKEPLDDDNDEYDSESVENDLDYEEDEGENYYDAPYSQQTRGGRRHRMIKRYSIFNQRRGEHHQSKKNKNKPRNNKGKSSKKSTGKYQQNFQNFKKFPPTNRLRPLTSLERLRMETDLRAKLLSDAQCPDVGLIDHSCPFNYQQMLALISSSLERQRTISFTSNKVLPMVGYLIKSRNYTGTLQATFQSIERINNYTLDNDREGKPIDFTHILDEVMNRVTGDAGLRIVDTTNDSGSASVWEDDEFDHVLENPYERRRPQSDNYKLDKKKKELRKKQKGSGSVHQADDQSKTSEEDTSEEGLIFDRPKPPPPNGPGGFGDADSSSEEEEDELNKVDEEKKKKFTGNKQSLVPPPVFGHLQKNATDE